MEFRDLGGCAYSQTAEVDKTRKADEFRQLELRWTRIHRKMVADGLEPPSFADYYTEHQGEEI